MSRPIKSPDQAFYKRKTKDSMLMFFWSSDWYRFQPWTYDGQKVGYVSKRSVVREQGRMTSYMLGPLLIVYYKNHLTSQ